MLVRMGGFSDKVFEMVNQIPRGKVASYGQIAHMIGSPRSARYVGFALRSNPDPENMPCHRVVFKDGGICESYAFGGPDVQRSLLEREGVAFVDSLHVDMRQHAWVPHDPPSGRPKDVDWEKEMGD